MIIRKKHKIEQLSANFKLAEFQCHCISKTCHYTLVEEELLVLLERLRQKIKAPLLINSAYRCQFWNKKVGGVQMSQHTIGAAVDIAIPEGYDKMTFGDICMEIFPFIKRYDTFIHCDLRSLL